MLRIKHVKYVVCNILLVFVSIEIFAQERPLDKINTLKNKPKNVISKPFIKAKHGNFEKDIDLPVNDNKKQDAYETIEFEQYNSQQKPKQPKGIQKGIGRDDDFESITTVSVFTISEGKGVNEALPFFRSNFKKYERLRGPSLFDSRIEIRHLDPDIDWQLKILNNNESVGIIIDKDKLHKVSDNLYQLDISTKLSDIIKLCKQEPFTDQPSVGVGTCFIVDKDLMLTANHVFTHPLKEYAIVFGFDMVNKNGIIETLIPEKDIYYPIKTIEASQTYDTHIFKVNKEINRPILEWENSQTLKKGTEIYMLGHPTGIPKKAAVNAGISDNKHPQYFYTSLDSFQGNSGSPVFNFETHKVIGVLVSGQLDYRFNGNCYESTLCQQPYCKGEKVIRIERILTLNPKE